MKEEDDDEEEEEEEIKMEREMESNIWMKRR